VLHPHHRFDLAKEGAFYTIAFSCTLRGEEVPLADLNGISKHWEASVNHNPPHITIALLGHFKGEIGESYHLLPIVPITWSGIDNKKWVGRLVNFYQSQNITTGPFFRNATGHRMRAGDIEQIFFDCLEQVQSLRSDLISSSEEVEEEYGIYRSFR
jgi:hypothetical protein